MIKDKLFLCLDRVVADRPELLGHAGPGSDSMLILNEADPKALPFCAST